MLIKVANDTYINLDNVRQIIPVPVSEYTGAKPGTLRVEFAGPVDQDHGYTWVESDEAIALRTWLERNSEDVQEQQRKTNEALEAARAVSDALGMAEWSTPDHAEAILNAVIEKHWNRLDNALEALL